MRIFPRPSAAERNPITHYYNGNPPPSSSITGRHHYKGPASAVALTILGRQIFPSSGSGSEQPLFPNRKGKWGRVGSTIGIEGPFFPNRKRKRDEMSSGIPDIVGGTVREVITSPQVRLGKRTFS